MSDQLDISNKSQKRYRISTKKRMGPGAAWGSAVNVDSIEELRHILKEEGAYYVTLAYNTYFDDLQRYHKRSLVVDDMNEEDLEWLTEKTDYDSRFVEFSSRKH